MTGEERREKIFEILLEQEKAVSASRLAELFLVSRQIIVSDIALLRASNRHIIATSKGYVLESPPRSSRYFGTLACSHSENRTQEELYLVVDNGGEVINVGVEHPLYGEIVGNLGLSSRKEVDEFLEKSKENNAKLLTDLTYGVHFHTVATKDQKAFEAIKQKLLSANILFTG